MTVVTRFAPSPTGFLHIGSARTALFNYLFARHFGGQFLLRIEDTDRVRSTPEAIEAIISGLKWLGLDWDHDPIFQFERYKRHQEVALEMVAKGHAYYCYATPEELEEMRTLAGIEGRPLRYDGRWRNRSQDEAPEGVKPVVRLKALETGETHLKDLVQGEITVSNTTLDDMVLLRSDGTPTYMLAVVVDDHDMGITHVIRGDDHLTNTFRQIQIYDAMGWERPQFAHIPLIHGPDGAKLSKRHGALGVEAYRDMGFLPEAMCNYLLRLGWSHGDDEIISEKQAIEWFNLDHVGRSPSRFDMAKLLNVNAHYLKEEDNAKLLGLILPFLEKTLGRDLLPFEKDRLLKGMEGLKVRSKTILELQEAAYFYVAPLPFSRDEKAQSVLTEAALILLKDLKTELETSKISWTETPLHENIQAFVEKKELKLKDIAQPLRVALTGSLVSPGLFEVMEILGKEESLRRIEMI
ncbi:MAG: glutamate--tRNA ligase [Alphaproteobacteria bacterium 16-39-46]|nr:MAG: glutamate--tRNA ligase [Alphaproteobacteria bacterium 16-39-46]OZA44543.1 MAG: glutamate--tRNA ligase [Alphaproteobacteria bacterium 17-39-52]HQS83392.1 glutamate--tRNA ligase [Alphaproteobacteria bacterium]HQS93079.1 glutamate--tRNA ligase [Alphaproteobacteria bacterium]